MIDRNAPCGTLSSKPQHILSFTQKVLGGGLSNSLTKSPSWDEGAIEHNRTILELAVFDGRACEVSA